jgi:hypothetical protein
VAEPANEQNAIQLRFCLQPFDETLPIGEMRQLCRFERLQDVSRHACRSRLAATMPLKLIDDLTLTQNMSFAITNVAFGLAEAIEEYYTVHNDDQPFGSSVGSGGHDRGKWPSGIGNRRLRHFLAGNTSARRFASPEKSANRLVNS